MSYTWRPSKRAGSTGLVTLPNGGRAIGGILANGSHSVRSVQAVRFALSATAVSASLHTANAPVAGNDVPRGKFSFWNASPPGWSMRSIHVLPLPPPRCDVKTRYFPSGDHRGFELSVPGDVKRCGSPPVYGTTHTSRWYLLSFSFTVCTVNATRWP